MGLIILILTAGFYGLRNRDYLVDVFGGRGREVTLFYTPKDSVLAVLDANLHSLSLIGIPSELYSEVTPDYGDYRFGAVFKLGEIDGEGMSLVRSAAYNIFAVGIDKVVLVNKDFDIGLGDNLSLPVKKEIFKGIFWFKTRGLKPSEIRFFNLRLSDSVSELVLPDNSKALKFDSYYFDKQIGSIYLRDTLAVSEKLKAEVFNGSQIPGLGEKTARYLTNMGLDVFSVSNTDEVVNNCKIKYNKALKKSYALFRIGKDMGCSFEIYGDAQVPRTDLTVILGKISN